VGVEQRGHGRGAASIPDTVRYSFDIGAVVLAGAMLWTSFTTREYPPGNCMASPTPRRLPKACTPGSAAHARHAARCGLRRHRRRVLVWYFHRRAELYILCGLFGAWGAALLSTRERREGMFATLMRDIDGMPARMRQLIPVQFFSGSRCSRCGCSRTRP
jgi:maltose/moltooligosaccharide transporter